MARFALYPPETREAVEGMLRDGVLSMRSIAACTGISSTTVWSWNRAAGIRSVGAVCEPGSAVRRSEPKRRRSMPARHGPPPGDVPDLATLDAALRAHIARQIAVFDDGLRAAQDAARDADRAAAAIDTAKILRDLGGLKRLLDDLGAAARQPDAEGDADGGAPEDLAALRERLARRLAAFAAEPDPAAAGEPGPCTPAPAG